MWARASISIGSCTGPLPAPLRRGDRPSGTSVSPALPGRLAAAALGNRLGREKAEVPPCTHPSAKGCSVHLPAAGYAP